MDDLFVPLGPTKRNDRPVQFKGESVLERLVHRESDLLDVRQEVIAVSELGFDVCLDRCERHQPLLSRTRRLGGESLAARRGGGATDRLQSSCLRCAPE